MKRFLIIILTLLCTLAVDLQAQDDTSLLRSAHSGNVAAMRKIGIRMHKRLCSRGSPALGLQWIKKAADHGDADALYYLGTFYLGSNKELGESYLRRAAESGHEKAGRYFDKVVTEKKEAWENRVGARRFDRAIEDAVAAIQEKVTETGVTEIAMVEFLCNGGSQNKMTKSVRSRIQKALLDGANIKINDRVDTKMLAEESDVQGEALELHSSMAVFMGEIICKPGGDVGYFIYRVFHTKDMRIVAAGFVPVKWTSFDKDLLNGISMTAAPTTLPFTPKRDLDNMVEHAQRKVQRGIAMVHDGKDPDNNTIEHRVAFAQVLDAFFQAGLTLYEREFMEKGAEEASVSGETVQADRVGALCTVKLVENTKKNGLEVKVTSYPNGNLLFIDDLTQKRGSVLNRF